METSVKKIKLAVEVEEEESKQVSSQLFQVSLEKISSSAGDYVRVQCSLCPIKPMMTSMRSHVRSHHQINIKEYKEIYGPLVPLEVMQFLIILLLQGCHQLF